MGAWVWDASAVANGAEEPVNDQFRDGPWYRVRTEVFEVSFLPDHGQDVETVRSIARSDMLASKSRRMTTYLCCFAA
jgi:hypothetical protein